MPTAQSNGINIFFEVHGQGDPLLMIAGLATDVTQLGELVQKFSRQRKVIAFDNRGVGRTDKPDAPYSIDMMGDDAAGLLDSVGVAKADVFGFSMGGKVALSLALRHPEKVGRLVLVSTSARINNRRGFLWSLSNLMQRIPMVRGVGTKYPQPYFAYVRQRDASVDYDVHDKLQSITVPTLILHGRKDRIAPYRLAEEMNSGIQGSSLVGLDGGHLIVFSRRKELVSCVEAFLGSRSPAPTKL